MSAVLKLPIEDIREPGTQAVTQSPVTLQPKRYMHVFVCAACDLLGCSVRAHSITCSTACRVRLHRSTALRELRAKMNTHCKTVDITFASVLEAKAIDRLIPEYGRRIRIGELKIEDVRGELWMAFWKLIELQLPERAQ